MIGLSYSQDLNKIEEIKGIIQSLLINEGD